MFTNSNKQAVIIFIVFDSRNRYRGKIWGQFTYINQGTALLIENTMKKVIFDTDIGVDDAMALLFLHFAPGVDLLAIVTGFGNASIENTTRNALHMNEKFGIAVPVYRGSARPLSDDSCEKN